MTTAIMAFIPRSPGGYPQTFRHSGGACPFAQLAGTAYPRGRIRYLRRNSTPTWLIYSGMGQMGLAKEINP